MEMLISPLSAENRVIRDFWGIKIARDIRVIFLCVFSSEFVSNLLGADERT